MSFSGFEDRSIEKRIASVLKMLEIPALQVYETDQISKIFGDDVSGINICCSDGVKLLLIQCTHSKFGTNIKEMVHFMYSSDIIQKTQPIVPTKLWATTTQMQLPEQIASQRGNVICMSCSDNISLVGNVVEFVKSFFGHISVPSVGTTEGGAGTGTGFVAPSFQSGKMTD